MNSRGLRSRVLLLSAAIAAVAAPAYADSVEAVLGLNQRVSMEALAKSVADPSSVRYRQFYTSDEIRAIAGPSDAQYQLVLDELKANGATIVRESPTHLWVAVRAERSYLVRLQATLRSPLLRTGAFAQIASLSGLAPGAKRHPLHHFIPIAPKDAPNTGMQPATIRTLYGFDPIYAPDSTARASTSRSRRTTGSILDDVNQYSVPRTSIRIPNSTRSSSTARRHQRRLRRQRPDWTPSFRA